MRKIPELEPCDALNLELLSHVHPAGHRNPEPARRYNLVVVGGGTAGLVTAAVAAGVGARVALVERNLMGGDCLNVGCVPSKSLIRSARAVGELRKAAVLGVNSGGPIDVDFSRVMERMRSVRSAMAHHDSVERFSMELGVDVFLGDARFVSGDTVEVEGGRLRFSRAVIATGARPVVPPIPGLDEVGYLTNETVFSLTERPARLAIIGAGPIGCELSQTFQRLGSQVSLLERMPQVLGREDVDAADVLNRALIDDGVELLTSAAVQSVEEGPDGKVLFLRVAGSERALVVDEILVSAGRQPNVHGIDLERAGVAYDVRNGVQVNDYLRTTNRHIFAAGDICHPLKFTHAADAAAKMVVRNALFFGRKRASDMLVPWCIYTDPEVAHVGLGERAAEEERIAIDTYKVELRQNDRSLTENDVEGFAKVHVKKGSDRILGATLVAARAGEMIGEISVAMRSGMGLGALGDVIRPYPTQAEVWKAASGQYARTRLTPAIARSFKTFLAWTR